MNSTRYLVELRPTLHRIPSSAGTRAQCLSLRIGAVHSAAPHQLRGQPRLHPAPARCFQTAAPLYKHKSKRTQPIPAAAAASRAERWSHVPTNRDILRYEEVYVVEAETNRMLGPMRSEQALKRVNLAAEAIRVVQESGGPNGKPICRIFNLNEEAARDRERQEMIDEQVARQKQKKIKILELGWSIAENDLAHKLQRMSKFLEQGHRLEVVFAPKRGMREVDKKEKNELVDSVTEHLSNVPGAKEVKKPSGSVSRLLTLFWEGSGQAAKN